VWKLDWLKIVGGPECVVPLVHYGQMEKVDELGWTGMAGMEDENVEEVLVGEEEADYDGVGNEVELEQVLEQVLEMSEEGEV
jgi:hypothetical protein